MYSDRKHNTIFYVLSHLLMHCADGVDKEKIFNVFANEVLIPSDKFNNLIGESYHDISLVELQTILREDNISVDALMVKVAQLNIITDRRFSKFGNVITHEGIKKLRLLLVGVSIFFIVPVGAEPSIFTCLS